MSSSADARSVVAKLLGVSRHDAKVLNYGRLYGAGEMYAKQLLAEFNPTATPADVNSLTRELFMTTKGKRLSVCTLNDKYRHIYYRDFVNELKKRYPSFKQQCYTMDTPVEFYSTNPANVSKGMSMKMQLFADWLNNKPDNDVDRPPTTIDSVATFCEHLTDARRPIRRWIGGSESEVFNSLEQIALSEEPRTPVLGCPLSKALIVSADAKEYEVRKCVFWKWHVHRNFCLPTRQRASIGWCSQLPSTSSIYCWYKWRICVSIGVSTRHDLSFPFTTR
jgi:DNA polymerase gamma 1